MADAVSDGTLAGVRVGVLGLVVLGLLGTAVELALLAHDEDVKQFIPFVTIGIAIAAVAWRIARPHRFAVRAVQLAMAALIFTGMAGVMFHYQANMEFQVELDRSLGGVALIMKVLEAKAPPALAPANMALLGLMGLAAVYRDTQGG